MPGPNLVLNPGFETGNFTDWTATDPDPGVDIGVDNQPEDVNSGTYGVFAGNAVTTTLSQTIATTVGDTYNIAFFLDVYQSDATDGGMTATFGGQTAVSLTAPAETDNGGNPFMEYSATITATSTSSVLEFTFKDPPGFFGLDDVSVTDETACYVRGARILTDRGEVAVERLRVGDLAVTASGALRPIRWLGHRRIDITRHPDPAAVRPVRVSAGAFGGGLPRRDLWLSPGHNVAAEGVLTPISCLINGRSVAQVERRDVEYWHVELDAHDVIFAEGLPAESYLDCGNRTAFANGGAFIEAHPDFAPKRRADTCLPLVMEGRQVVATKARLLARLADEGHEVDQEAGAHIVVDGLRVEPERLSETQLRFVLPAGGREISLRSNVFIPAHTVAESADARELGLCIGRLQVDGAAVELDDDEACAAGWRKAEFADGRFSHRWTTGATPVLAGARIVIVDLAGAGYYWRARAGVAACVERLKRSTQ